MLLRVLWNFTSVFFLACIIDYKVFVKGEFCEQDIKDSCLEKELSSIQNEFQPDEADYRNNNLESIYVKNNLSELDRSKTNSSNANNATVHVSCVLKKTHSSLPVEIVNASKLAVLLQIEPNITNRQIPGSCIAVLFYSPNCPFSCVAAPHFNALPRFFPDLKMVAIDVIKHRSMNAQFGIVGTPTLMLFHNGRPAAKFNETSEYRLELFSNFITKHTGVKPVGKLVVMSADFGGPVPSVPAKETDYYLILSWSFIAARLLYSFYYSTWGRRLVDSLLNAWREAEAQHHHAD